MTYWEGPSRWINTMLLFVVGVIGLDTLFRLLGANEENPIVGGVRRVAAFFLAPFEGMFVDQEFLLTAIIAVLGYSLLAGVALAVVRSIQASRREIIAAREVRQAQEVAEPAVPARRREEPVARESGDDDPQRTRRL